MCIQTLFHKMLPIKSERIFLVIVVLSANIFNSDALKCYQCDSWEHNGCADGSYLEDKYYNECYFKTSLYSVPAYCLKEITTFSNLGNTNAKYHQPHVVRRCTSIPSLKVYRSSSFQAQEDYDDECEKKSVQIQSISGVRKICSCSTDGCNSAVTLFKTTFYGKLLFALTMSIFVTSVLTSPV